MFVRRFFHPRLAQSSYLIGCGVAREGIVIDPLRDVEQYVTAAAAEGVRITAVTETHVHADFLSGSHELAAITGAQLYLSGEERGPWSYSDEYIRRAHAMLLHDAYVIRIGTVRVDVARTPGHTPEHLTFLITDTADAAEPMGAVTGDFVFVGDVGRPDLLERAVHVVGSADGAARQLFHSLQRFAHHADYLQLWPGHSAGSACGKGLSAIPQSTLGYERRHNWAFRVEDEGAFVAEVLQGQPEPPAYFANMKRANANGPPPWGAVTRPSKVSADQVAASAASGAFVVDTRPGDEFAAGHLAGTINIPLDRSFLTWAGSLIPPDGVVMLIGAEPALSSAVDDLALIGIDHVAGVAGLDVIDSWRKAGKKFGDVAETSVESLAASLQSGKEVEERSGEEVTVVDVRNAGEWSAGHIPGAVHVPLSALPSRLDSIPRDRAVVVHCQSGARAVIACSLLQSAGFTQIESLRGGFAAWQAAGHAVIADAAPSA
jgi:hydroxyacylglutathione hydrolase